jgi:hypothetical protein
VAFPAHAGRIQSDCRCWCGERVPCCEVSWRKRRGLAYVTSKQVWEHGGYRYQAHWAINTVTGETALAKLTAPWIR